MNGELKMTRVKKLSQAEQKAKKESEAQKLQEFRVQSVNSASFCSAVVTESFGKSLFPELGLHLLHNEIQASINAVQDGDMNGIEDMLVGQAKSLQTMFVSMARRANNQQYLKQYSTYMNLALKAQAQSRATIQALVEIKYPRQMIVTKQANITQGNQQVNNGVAVQPDFSDQYAHTRTHAGENQSDTNKLMELNHDENQTIDNQPQRLDARTTQTSITSHTPLETVESVHRRKNA